MKETKFYVDAGDVEIGRRAKVMLSDKVWYWTSLVVNVIDDIFETRATIYKPFIDYDPTPKYSTVKEI